MPANKVPTRRVQVFYNYDRAMVDQLRTNIFHYTHTSDAPIPVPCVFATPQRAFAQIAKQIARKSGLREPTPEMLKNVPLPMMSINRGAETLDNKRYIRYRNPRVLEDASEGKLMGVIYPQPIEIPYDLSVWARTGDELASINEQIIQMLRFNEMWLTVQHPLPVSDRRVHVQLMAQIDGSDIDPGDGRQRTLRRSYSFVAHGWLCYAPFETYRIEQVIVDFYDWDETERLDRLVVPTPSLETGEGAKEMNISVSGALIVGEAQVDETYGYYQVKAEMWITGMQVACGGRPPTGTDLKLQFVLNDTPNTDLELVLDAGTSLAEVTFGTAVHVQAGDTLGVKCTQVGSGDPGDWLEVQFDATVKITY